MFRRRTGQNYYGGGVGWLRVILAGVGSANEARLSMSRADPAPRVVSDGSFAHHASRQSAVICKISFLYLGSVALRHT